MLFETDLAAVPLHYPFQTPRISFYIPKHISRMNGKVHDYKVMDMDKTSIEAGAS